MRITSRSASSQRRAMDHSGWSAGLQAATPEAGSGTGVGLGSGLVGAADGVGAVAILVGLVWMTAYAHLVQRAHRTLNRRDVRRWIEGATGVVLIAVGVRVALERR